MYYKQAAATATEGVMDKIITIHLLKLELEVSHLKEARKHTHTHIQTAVLNMPRVLRTSTRPLSHTFKA